MNDRVPQREKYVPPFNALNDLITSLPHTEAALCRSLLPEVEKENPVGTWPDEPYHYGMGRILAYEQWRDSLPEEELKREIAACRARYTAHYERSFEILAHILRERRIVAPLLMTKELTRQARLRRAMGLPTRRRGPVRPDDHDPDHSPLRGRGYER